MGACVSGAAGAGGQQPAQMILVILEQCGVPGLCICSHLELMSVSKVCASTLTLKHPARNLSGDAARGSTPRCTGGVNRHWMHSNCVDREQQAAACFECAVPMAVSFEVGHAGCGRQCRHTLYFVPAIARQLHPCFIAFSWALLHPIWKLGSTNVSRYSRYTPQFEIVFEIESWEHLQLESMKLHAADLQQYDSRVK